METTIIKPTVKGFFIKRYLAWLPVSVVSAAAGALVLASYPEVDGLAGVSLIAAGALALGATILHSWLHRGATSIYFDDDKIVHETGILDHRKKKIPMNMVTDSSATRTLIEKLFGTGTFNISTSGSSGYEIVCDGLDYSELEAMHNSLYARLRKFGTRPAQPVKDAS